MYSDREENIKEGKCAYAQNKENHHLLKKRHTV